MPGEGEISYRYNQTDWMNPEAVVFPGGTSQEFAYSDLGQIKSITNKSADGALLFNYAYTFNSSNAIETKTSHGGTTTYGYDSGLRLTSITPSSGYITQ